MRFWLVALCAMALSACETVTVQGVEITPETQAASLFGLILAGTLIHELSDDDDGKQTCRRRAAPTEGKGEAVCLEYGDAP